MNGEITALVDRLASTDDSSEARLCADGILTAVRRLTLLEAAVRSAAKASDTLPVEDLIRWMEYSEARGRAMREALGLPECTSFTACVEAARCMSQGLRTAASGPSDEERRRVWADAWRAFYVDDDTDVETALTCANEALRAFDARFPQGGSR